MYSTKGSIPPPHGGHCCFRPPPLRISVIFQLGLVPPGKNISLKNAVALFFYAKDNCFCDTERTNIFIYVNLFDFFENQPNEICSHLSKRRHSNKGKGKQKRKSEEKERRRREKNNGCTLSFYNSYQKSG